MLLKEGNDDENVLERKIHVQQKHGANYSLFGLSSFFCYVGGRGGSQLFSASAELWLSRLERSVDCRCRCKRRWRARLAGGQSVCQRLQLQLAALWNRTRRS